jgi:thermitase
MRIRALLGAVLMSVGVASSARAAEPSSDALIVKRAPGLGAAELRERADLEPAGRVPGLERVDVVEPLDGDAARALAELRADPEVHWAEPVLPRRALADARFAQQWGLQLVTGIPGGAGVEVAALGAWAISRGAGETIAVVDSGVAADHPDLAPRLTGNPAEGPEPDGLDNDRNGFVDDWQGWDFVDEDRTPDDTYGHGTHVAGIAAAAIGGGDVIGVAPDAELLPLRVLRTNGTGTTADIAAAFRYAGRLGIRVVNASIGATGWANVERDAIRASPGTLFVVAAGNDHADAGATYPCAYPEPNVLCVGASTSRDEVASFSNFSATAVDLFAPGVGIVSTGWPSGYPTKDGTSMATPFAAGAAALVASAHPGWTPAQIKAALMDSVDVRPAFAGKSVSGGRLNAAAALRWVTPTGTGGTDPGATPSPAPESPPAAPAPAPQPGASAPPPASGAPAPAPAAATPVVSRLRIVGRPGRRSAALSFTTSAGGRVRLVLERRAGRGYKRAGTDTLTVARGAQRTRLGTRVAGVRLKRGTWRLTLAAARITFRVR